MILGINLVNFDFFDKCSESVFCDFAYCEKEATEYAVHTDKDGDKKCDEDIVYTHYPRLFFSKRYLIIPKTTVLLNF